MAKVEENGVEINEEHSEYKWIEIEKIEDLDILGDGKGPQNLGLT